MRTIGATLAARANVCAETVDVRTGRVLKRSWRHNLVVDDGLDLMRDLLYGDGLPITHGAVGTDATASAPADIGLGAEVFRDTISQLTKGATGVLAAKFVVGSTQANGETLREVGLFNDPTAGTLFARATPEAVVKSDAVLVIYTWAISFGVAS